MKTCTKCLSTKPYSEFHKDKYAKSGYYPSCISCNAHKRSDKEKKAAYDKGYRKTNGWKKKANQFKVTETFLKELLVLQDHACAICGLPETEKHASGTTMTLAIDHDHKTGKVRGFLCMRCNKAIGLMRDDPSVLLKAASYVALKGGRWTRSL